MMRQHHIRHLPVLDGGKLVGLVSQTDLHLIETLEGLEPDLVPVGNAMTALPYHVPPGEDLQQVARVMADQRFGCAIVVDGEKVVGIFTVTDAVRILADVLV